MGLIDALEQALGSDCVFRPAAISERYRGDWHVKAGPDEQPIALVLPRDTAQVSAVLRLCYAHETPVVPQGGLTGLSGGAVPIHGSVLLSLERLRAIEEVDPIASTITVQAGVPLQTVQEAADSVDLLFPLDIGGRGSCLIGGNIATNAGGNRVLRYGMARDLILGLEVVLADGTILTSLNKMLKNNTGYDLKQLFIGSEGTLGVITRAVLRLFPKPAGVRTGLCAFESFAQLYEFLGRARRQLGPSLAAFEVMWPRFYELAAAGRTLPLPLGHTVYLLVEAMDVDEAAGIEQFDRLVEGALTDGVIVDAVIAQSLAETQALWAIRDASGELMQSLRPVVNFDVSIETSRIAEFADFCSNRLGQRWRSAEAIYFGHLADSNLHIFVTAKETPFPEHDVEELVMECVKSFAGSVSAEHGIGLLKKRYLSYSRTSAELALMKTLKTALDPRGILNPGKIFD